MNELLEQVKRDLNNYFKKGNPVEVIVSVDDFGKYDVDFIEFKVICSDDVYVVGDIVVMNRDKFKVGEDYNKSDILSTYNNYDIILNDYAPFKKRVHPTRKAMIRKR